MCVCVCVLCVCVCAIVKRCDGRMPFKLKAFHRGRQGVLPYNERNFVVDTLLSFTVLVVSGSNRLASITKK